MQRHLEFALNSCCDTIVSQDSPMIRVAKPGLNKCFEASRTSTRHLDFQHSNFNIPISCSLSFFFAVRSRRPTFLCLFLLFSRYPDWILFFLHFLCFNASDRQTRAVMSNVHVAVAQPSDDLDDVRYEHHLKHRGQSNHRIFWMFWWSVTAFFAVKFASRTIRWWRRRM
jgi:hypothetical protein